MRKLLYLILLVGAGYYAFSRMPEQTAQSQGEPQSSRPTFSTRPPKDASDSSQLRDNRTERTARNPMGGSVAEDLAGSNLLSRAFESRQSNVQVQAAGVVAKILSDDNEGSRHQRFLVRLVTGQTILIAHNIDLAGRVTRLAVGDRVEFSGEYAWNDKGGVVHWTHRDPSNRHLAGWIKHDGATFQ